jgi:hypothetical protein
MKIWVDSGSERYPVYGLYEPDGDLSPMSPTKEFEVDQATYERWCAAFDAFDEVQRELEAIRFPA